jgi:hypothetical protein
MQITMRVRLLQVAMQRGEKWESTTVQQQQRQTKMLLLHSRRRAAAPSAQQQQQLLPLPLAVAKVMMRQQLRVM